MSTSSSSSVVAARREPPGRDLAAAAIPAIAIVCFAVHVVLLLATGTSMLTMVVAMLVLSGACVACSWRAGSSGDRRDHLVAAGAALTMIVVHLALMSGATHGGAHLSPPPGGLGAPGVVDALMNAGLALAAVQVVLASGAAARRSVA